MCEDIERESGREVSHGAGYYVNKAYARVKCACPL